MKYSKLIAMGLAIGVPSLGVPVSSVFANTTPTVPIESWAMRDMVTSVSLSPNGEHLLILKLEGGKTGEHVLEIYKTSDLSKPLRRLNSKPMELISARWVTDNHIFGTAWQVKRKTVNDPEADVRNYATYSYNLEKNKFAQIEGSFSIVGNLPKEPFEVLVSDTNAVTGGTGVDPFAAFRPRSYYRFNLNTGTKSLVLKGSEKYPTATFDIDGNPRFTVGYDGATKEQVSYYRLPGDGAWKEFERYDLDKHENLYRVLGGIYGLQGFDPNDPSKGYVVDNRGEDKAALWEFDFNTGKYGNKLYSNPDADVMAIQTHSMGRAGNTKMVAAIYPGAKYERHWFDMEEKALFESLEKKIPYAHQVSISSRSIDGNTSIVTNTGPKDPGSFWLLKDGKMMKLASRNPFVKPSDLSDVEFIKYPARDGKIIPAYVTKPKGPGPHPLIVLPHGGPHVNEVVDYDEWGQVLANSGYMVLQPQYRMSVGWGKDHFDSAYGQHGLAMQDDKDDGALYLVKQGLVDPKRMAMFGWSYGGYAALVAATRENNIYQCTVAGAAVADPEKTYWERRNPNSPKALDDWARRRGMIGVNPVKEAAKINIPVMMVHGDVDARVRYFNLTDYKKAMEKAGKLDPTVTVGVGDKASEGGSDAADPMTNGAPDATGATATATAGPTTQQPTGHRFVTLKGADHFYTTLMYEHQELLYTQLLDFLKKDCGPGGL